MCGTHTLMGSKPAGWSNPVLGLAMEAGVEVPGCPSPMGTALPLPWAVVRQAPNHPLSPSQGRSMLSPISETSRQLHDLLSTTHRGFEDKQKVLTFVFKDTD